MVDGDELDEQGLLFARVVARTVSLRGAGVMRRPCDFSTVGPERAPSPTAELLWSWSRLVADAQALLHEVFEPSLREPGREHLRSATLSSGRPRGAVNWPQTVARSLRAGQAGPPSFACTTAERSVFAPENLLLVMTLDKFLRRGLGTTSKLERSRLLAAGDRELFRRYRLGAERALAAPWIRACRERAVELCRATPRAELELERAVQQRIRGRPSAAPEWARSLLELRRRPQRIPVASSLTQLDRDELWAQLALLEVLILLRRTSRARQTDASFSCPSGLVFRRLDEAPVWVITTPNQPPIGVLRPRHTSWEQVRRDALYWSWTATLADADIDRWLIIHRADTHERERERGRGDIQLHYWRLRGKDQVGDVLTRKLGLWLPS